jgi:hypothetical protein
MEMAFSGKQVVKFYLLNQQDEIVLTQNAAVLSCDGRIAKMRTKNKRKPNGYDDVVIDLSLFRQVDTFESGFYWKIKDGTAIKEVAADVD